MTIEELVEEVNQFIEDDERKIRVEDAKAALSATSPASCPLARVATAAPERTRKTLEPSGTTLLCQSRYVAVSAHCSSRLTW
jgi:hypothetical protein